MAEWRDIESAPKDGKDVLVYCSGSGEQFVAFNDGRKDNYFQFATSRNHGRMMCEPTHWQPLPEPPK